MEVEGASSVEINSLKRVVSITLEETADIRNVQIRNIGFNVPEVKPSWDICGEVFTVKDGEEAVCPLCKAKGDALTVL